MCLAVPAKVISITDRMALVAVEGVEYPASLALLEGVRPGDYVMVHAGFAISLVEPDEAAETLRLLKEISSHAGEDTGGL